MVTSAAARGPARKLPSLSSASMTNHRPLPWAAAPPSEATSAPIRKEGSSPAATRAVASIDVVVVLPWVPDTDRNGWRAASAGSRSIRRSTGMRRSRAATHLDVVGGHRRGDDDQLRVAEVRGVVADVDPHPQAPQPLERRDRRPGPTR